MVGELGVFDLVIGACFASRGVDGKWTCRTGVWSDARGISPKNLGHAGALLSEARGIQSVLTRIGRKNRLASQIPSRLPTLPSTSGPQTLPVRHNCSQLDFVPLTAVEMPNPIMRNVSETSLPMLALRGERASISQHYPLTPQRSALNRATRVFFWKSLTYEGEMARNNTRVGRRRRVLNEEVLSASNIAIHTGGGASDFEPGDTPRYGAGANIENHPQVTSFVPRRFRTLCGLAAVGVAVAAGAETVAFFAESLSALVKVSSASEITEVFANRLIAWTSAVMLVLTMAYTRLIYSLRRHRVDDERGRYRVWRTAGYAALLLSLNSVLGAHQLIAKYLGSIVDWQLLPAHAGWWLVPSALIGGWLLIRLIRDASECRTALSVYVLAAACFVVAGVSSSGWSPAWAATVPELMSRSLPLVGFTLLLVASQLFARYVILDVQGLIVRADVESERDEIESKPVSKAKLAKSTVEVPPEEEQPAEESEWVDGSEPETDYDDEPTPRLSKAQRKRLRKQKQRNRAA